MCYPCLFSPFEVKSMLCGDQSPVFTKDDIIKFTEPKLGYTRESPAFLKFVNVLVNFTDAERKAFLQFTTGCSSLPPGKVYFIQDLPLIEKSFQFCLFLLSYKESFIYYHIFFSAFSIKICNTKND